MSKDTVTSNIFISGQRWSSNSEPELGLGIIESVDQQFVNILFPACDELRQYSTDSPPLYRMRFQAGATIQDVNGQEHQVEQVSEKGGLITYHCGKTQIPELKLGLIWQIEGLKNV